MQGDCGNGSVSEEDNHLVLSSSEDSSTPDECELGLGLSLGGNDGSLKMKRKAQRIGPKILTAEDFDSLVSASSSPSSCSSSSSTSGRANGGGGTKRDADSISASNAASQVVGWPPIRAYRMNNLTTNNGKSKELDSESERRNCVGNITHQDSSNLCLKPFLVKVNLDGVPIGRKVDLNAHNCYETLSQTLENMFFPTHPKNVSAGRDLNLLNCSSGFALTYEDKDGDMMLVGDVPWRMFVNSVKRLRIMRSTKANGIMCM